MIRPRRLVLFWSTGIAVLFILNFYRDLGQIEKRMKWEVAAVKPLVRTVTSPGVIEAVRVESIKSEVTESVVKTLVEEGAAVETGQLLIELTRTRTQLEFEQMKTAFANAEADYRKAVRELKIQKELYRNQAVPRSQVEEAARSAEKAQAARDISRREFDIARAKLDSTDVRSPMDGVVLKRSVDAGAKVAPDKELIMIGDTSRFVVRAKVDELDIRQVRVGQEAVVRVDAFPDREVKGVVKSVATQAEREAFAKVEVLVDITDTGVTDTGQTPLKHNLSVQLDIRTEQIPDAIGISQKAIQRKSGDKAWILVKTRGGLVRERQVTLGTPAGTEIQVLSGLKEGDQVGVPLPLVQP